MMRKQLLPILLLGCLFFSGGERIEAASQPLQQQTITVEGLEPDPELIEMLAPYREEVAKLEVPIIQSAVSMPNLRRENPLGSWVSDALRASASDIIGIDMDFAFVNSGGIRAAMPQGDVSYRTISSILPFDNSLVYYELKGSELRQIIEELARRKGWDPISGGTIEADADGNLTKAIIGDKPLDDEGDYTFATISFLAEGGGGWDILTTFEKKDTGIMIRDVVYKHVQKLAAEGKQIEPPTNPTRYLIGGKTVEELNQ